MWKIEDGKPKCECRQQAPPVASDSLVTVATTSADSAMHSGISSDMIAHARRLGKRQRKRLRDADGQRVGDNGRKAAQQPNIPVPEIQNRRGQHDQAHAQFAVVQIAEKVPHRASNDRAAHCCPAGHLGIRCDANGLKFENRITSKINLRHKQHDNLQQRKPLPAALEQNVVARQRAIQCGMSQIAVADQQDRSQLDARQASTSGRANGSTDTRSSPPAVWRSRCSGTGDQTEKIARCTTAQWKKRSNTPPTHRIATTNTTSMQPLSGRKPRRESAAIGWPCPSCPQTAPRSSRPTEVGIGPANSSTAPLSVGVQIVVEHRGSVARENDAPPQQHGIRLVAPEIIAVEVKKQQPTGDGQHDDAERYSSDDGRPAA